MRIKDAKAIMRTRAGYRVHFERRADGLMHSDYFPERDEPPIAELDDAWKLAAQWADVDPSVYVNVYVIYAHDWTPVDNYRTRRLNTHPPVLENGDEVGISDARSQ